MKKRYTLLWGLLLIAITLGLPLLLFGTVSGAFLPPPADSPEAQRPPLPEVLSRHGERPSESAAIAPITPQSAEGAPSGEAEAMEAARIAELVRAFYERHPRRPEDALGYRPEFVREDFFDIGVAVLKRGESDNTWMQFVRRSDSLVRVAAIHGLCFAWNSLNASGTEALVGFLGRQSEEDLNAIMVAAVEALVDDTEAGRQSNVQMLLMFLGDYGRPAMPHLIWVSNNHPDADMRVWSMNTAVSLDPASAESMQTILRRLADPSGAVRLQALQAAILRPLSAYAMTHGNVPPWYLQLRPGDAIPDSGVVQGPSQKHA
ncbi:MAG: hypothetical protein HYV27_23810 [Candidatus Hydrogenedentes bacterium]|nr:hypothetical protein [Candidatus Hydrogenedentota bacterium]